MKKYLFLMAVFFIGCSNKEYILFQKDKNITKPLKTNLENKKPKKIVYEYKIMPGDLVSVTVFNHPELSTTNGTEIKGIPVYDDGKIHLPLIGFVEIAGLTQKEATLKIQKLYSQYLKKPYVQLNVLTKKVYVLGEVNKPGVVLLDKDYTTLIEAISAEGGFKDTARRDKIIIISGGLENPEIREVDLTKISSLNYKNLLLKPNDIVYVQPNNMKPLDVKIQGVQPIVSFVNSILSTMVNVKILTK